MITTEEIRASHDALEAVGECLTIVNESESGLVFKYESETLEEMLERLRYDVALLYNEPATFNYTDLTGSIKRMRGLPKTNALYEGELMEAAALRIFHSLVYECYHIDSIEQDEDGLHIDLRENWL